MVLPVALTAADFMIIKEFLAYQGGISSVKVT